MDTQKLIYLAAMDIQPWFLKQKKTTPAADEWETLRSTISGCVACALHRGRTQTVFGVGDRHAELMLIGEAPGFHEDQKGEPFVGRAGQLLNAMLEAIGLERKQIFIANILKCRPPNNRDPLPEEVNQCTPFLEKQIALIQPKLLVALGRIAAHYLLETTLSLSQIRRKTYSFGVLKTPLIVTYHPAYLLRTPRDKSKAFEDLQLIDRTLRNL